MRHKIISYAAVWFEKRFSIPFAKRAPLSGNEEIDIKRQNTGASSHGEDPMDKASMDVHRLVDEVAAVTETLKDICKAVEPDFLKVGEQLQSIFIDAGKMTGRTIEAVQDASGASGQSSVSLILTLAGDSLSTLEATRSELADSLGLLEEVMHNLGNVHRLTPTLTKIARSLNMVALSLSVESARCEQAREVFGALAADIKELSKAVAKVAGNIISDGQAGEQSLSTVVDEMGQGLGELVQLAEASAQAVNHAAPAAERFMALSMDVLGQAGQQAEQISRRVGEIVVGIQIHDNISQRVEHIVDSLAELGEFLTEGAVEKAGTGSGDCLGKAHSVIKLQAAQLERLIEEVETAHHGTLKAFEEIGIIVGKVLDTLSTAGFRSGGFDERADNNPIDTLKAAITSLQGLFGCGTERVARLKGAMEKSTETAALFYGYMAHVENINIDIHFKALNAIISLTKLGDRGKVIEAPAQEMKELGNRGAAFIAEIEPIMRSIKNSNEILKNRTEAEQHSDLGGKLAAGIRTFSDSCVVFNQRAENIFLLGGTLRQKIEEVMAHLVFLENFSSALRVPLSTLEELIERVFPWGETAGEGLATDNEKISGRYTMEQERAVHEQLFQGDVSAGNGDVELPVPGDFESVEPYAAEHAKSATEKQCDVDDDLGENVELF